MSKVSLSNFARHVGISRTTVRDLELQNVIDRTKGIDSCRLAFIAYLRERRSNGGAEADALRAARAREIEQRIAERERKSIPMTESLAFADDLLGVVLTEFSCLPARSSRDLAVRKAIDDEVYAARVRLADHFAAKAKKLEQGE